ncbi:multicopper oxidase family protein [Stackebrandtia nassauensis]|uniref:Bilirubin oxidase n=1 Tax=Stackebrandtia nassauensis (strain DSM 44728 / CIP 108903 / NRRL B-16338 / NBRC 102104 / LLR-40K-21) TaxID=446470 RepID=D3Q473_STANL|nr:multicopper oxidase domain-containing protein [Stackebrandtia nassauensis]ADD45958.1 Bilirubin oxidase [Stackebrandtia nassauensis DSM 44728]
MQHEADKNPGEGPQTPPPKVGWSVIPERKSQDASPKAPMTTPMTTEPKDGPHARPTEPERVGPPPPAPRNTQPTTLPSSSEPSHGGMGVEAPYSIHDDYPGKENLQYLALPDGLPDHSDHRSPPVTAFKDPLPLLPVAEPEREPLVPAPDGRRHQLFDQFKPEKYYIQREEEFQTQLHSDYGKVTWTWGIEGSRPGPTIHARYGEPILMRRFNNLPMLGTGKVEFAMPSTTRHTHNGHNESASDGNPDDWADTGDFWDHHFANFPATVLDPRSGKRVPDEREKMTTLWYHDHRRDFTGPNVYAGLVGTYLYFDDQDSGDENDPNPYAWRLPSGEFDQPLVLQDLMITEDYQLMWEPRDTMGLLGDRFSVNGVIQPHHRVKRRKYRFRLVNASVSRFYNLNLNFARNDTGRPEDDRFVRMIAITGDGNLQPEPLETEQIMLGPAQRVDIIVDFSKFDDGDILYLENRLDQDEGHGPSGRQITDPQAIREKRLMRFDVRGGKVNDPSRIPDFFRPFPEIDSCEIVRKRRWLFDYTAGLFVINGKAMDSNRIDAGIEINTAEEWTFYSIGNIWSHPVHSHLSEWLVQEVNGVPVEPDMVQIAMFVNSVDDFQRVFKKKQSEGKDYKLGTNVLRGPFCGGYRRDIALLAPATSITMYSRWPDFLGRYVLHCHNLVHEDAAMMIRWDVLPPGKGFDGSKTVQQVYGAASLPVHNEAVPAHVKHVAATATIRDNGEGVDDAQSIPPEPVDKYPKAGASDDDGGGHH